MQSALGSHSLEQQYATTSRSSEQNHQQYHVAQSNSYNPLSDRHLSQYQPDYPRGENPRNSHGTRLRPVSELRESTSSFNCWR